MEQSLSWEAKRFSASQEIPRIYGTRRFITAFTRARHLSLSWARSIQSMSAHPTSWRSILLLYYHLCLGLPSSIFPLSLLTKPLYTPPLPHTCYVPRIFNSKIFNSLTIAWRPILCWNTVENPLYNISKYFAKAVWRYFEKNTRNGEDSGHLRF
jgi:hypothetical protein